jgi:hypothetical protein
MRLLETVKPSLVESRVARGASGEPAGRKITLTSANSGAGRLDPQLAEEGWCGMRRIKLNMVAGLVSFGQLQAREDA